MSGGFAVTVRTPDGSASIIRVPAASSLIVGRDPTCHVVLPSPAVSRVHLRVDRVPGGLRATDQSSNGTTLGDDVVPSSGTLLAPDAELRVGPYVLKVEAVPPPCGESDAAPPALRRRIHRSLLDNLDLASLDDAEMDSGVLRPRVVDALRQIVSTISPELPPSLDRVRLVEEMVDETLGLGPLQELLEDETISEIMVVDPNTIYVEKGGKLHLTSLRFMDDESCRAAIERIVTPLGRRIDESTPLVDARLRDGSRVNAIIPPLAIRGPCITIRKFSRRALEIEQLIALGSLSRQMATFLQRCVRARKNIVISGGTGSPTPQAWLSRMFCCSRESCASSIR